MLDIEKIERHLKAILHHAQAAKTAKDSQGLWGPVSKDEHVEMHANIIEEQVELIKYALEGGNDGV